MNGVGVRALLLSLPVALVERAAELPQQALRVAATAEVALDEAVGLLGRVRGLLTRIEALVGDVDDVAGAAGVVVARVAQVAEQVAGVATDAAGTRELAEEQVRRLQRLLDLYEPELQLLAPAVRDLAGPALNALAEIGPSLSDVTDRIENVGAIVEGLPGARLLRRRGEAAHAEVDEAAEDEAARQGGG